MDRIKKVGWLLILVAFYIVIIPNKAFAAEWGSIGFGTKNVRSFYVNPNDNQKMILSLNGSEDAGKVFITESGGGSWSQATMSPSTGYCNQFIKSPNIYNEFWAACSNGIYRSNDNAKTFKRIEGNAPKTAIDKILINKSGSIFVVYLNNICYSTDGIFWSNLTLPGRSSYMSAFLDENSSNLYISKSGDNTKSPGLYRSIDDGKSWEKLDGEKATLSGLTSMIFFKNNQNKICATSLGGFACSENNGFTWSVFKSVKTGVGYEPNYFYTAIQNPDEENNLIILSGGLYNANKRVYFSIDGGVSWESVKAPDYSSNISISTGDIFLWSPNPNWLKGVWKSGEIAAYPEYLKKHPVIIVPGLLGSYHDPLHPLSGLQLDPIFDTYDGLIDSLDRNGFEKDKMLFVFPYNWRNDNSETAKLLKIKIDEVKRITGSRKVDIVAHSMGGLVTRSYAQSNYYENDIDQIIFLGTPHLGAPKAYPIWEAGDVKFMGGNTGTVLQAILYEEADIKGYSGKNKLFYYIRDRIDSLPQLLPIFDYLKFNNGEALLKYPDLYPTNAFLEQLDNTKSTIIKRKIRVTNIIGDNSNNTTTGFVLSLSKSNKSPLWENGEPIDYYSKNKAKGVLYGKGDDTVPFNSNNYFFNKNIVLENVTHGELPSKSINLILKELGVVKEATCSLKPIHEAVMFIAHSPIDFYILSPDGEKIGSNFNEKSTYNEIANAYYSGNDPNEPEFVLIPNPLSGVYKVVLIGTNNGDYQMESIFMNEVNNEYYTSLYKGIAVFGEEESLEFLLNKENQFIRQTNINKNTVIGYSEVSNKANGIQSSFDSLSSNKATNINNEKLVLGSFIDSNAEKKGSYCQLDRVEVNKNLDLNKRNFFEKLFDLSLNIIMKIKTFFYNR